MNNFKFRGWNEVAKKMISWNELINMNLNNIFVLPKTTGIILMQYTGLRDKNGKEIYEGDIVQEVFIDEYDNNKERRYEKYIVEYDIDRGGYIPFACGDGCGCCESNVISTEDAEVIGNIYDNPELLEN